MIRKIVTAVVLVPLVIVIVMFAIANRQIVTVSFDPFNPAQPAYALPLPLFILIFILVGLGVVIGGFAAWLRQARWRRAARRLDSETRRLNDEARLRRSEQSAPRADDAARREPLVLPPPA